MERAPCCEKRGLKKGPWTPEEDMILISHIHKHGHGNWRALPKQAGLLRCGKSCRLRWTNYLRPDIKRGNFTKEEEETIIKLHEKLGNRWSAIAARLPRRTDNEIKNVWHTHLKKRLKNYQPPHNTKRHSSTLPNYDDSKVPEQENVNTGCFHRQESISFHQKHDATTSMPVSPQDSSSCEMSSVTDSSAANMINSNLKKIKQDEMDSSEHLPQNDFSREILSSAMNTNLKKGDELVIKHEEMDSLGDKFPQIDQSFWSEELPMDHITIEESRFQFPSFTNVNTMMCDNVCSSSKLEDDMDFWFNLFIKPEDLPNLL